jgi:hypothetical protein
MMGESFDCQICFELFEISGKHEPCVVDCGHTLCCECVTRLKSLRGAARCPFCKFPITPHRVFPKNYSLLDAMSSYHDSLTVATNTNAVAAADSTAVGAPPPDEALESASNEVSQCLCASLPPSLPVLLTLHPYSLPSPSRKRGDFSRRPSRNTKTRSSSAIETNPTSPTTRLFSTKPELSCNFSSG